MIKHKVTKTTTATTPPIKAWSVPCCPTALGSEEGETDRETKKADEGVALRGEVRRARAGGGGGRGHKTDEDKTEEKDDF